MNKNPSVMTVGDVDKTKPVSAWKPWDALTNLTVSDIQTPPGLTAEASWWSVCGGTNRNNTAGGGYVGQIHASTRSFVGGTTTRETPNRMVFTDSSLLTLANENVVSHWSYPGGVRTHRVVTGLSCLCAGAVGRAEDGYDERLAVGGVGNTVDMFDGSLQRTSSLFID